MAMQMPYMKDFGLTSGRIWAMIHVALPRAAADRCMHKATILRSLPKRKMA